MNATHNLGSSADTQSGISRVVSQNAVERGVAPNPEPGEPTDQGGARRGDGVSRRKVLTVGAASTLLGAGAGVLGSRLLGTPSRSPDLLSLPDRSGAPPVTGVHLQFGADASTEAVVSWHSSTAVGNPRVMLGTPTGGFGRVVSAQTVTYRDAKANNEVRIHHARVPGLNPDTDYIYAATHDGATAELGTFRTAPSGRAAFRFTSFGDQSTPALNALVDGRYVSDSFGSPAAGDMTAAVERFNPLFHLVNGDLCYANMARDRIRTWSNWFENNSRSARYRPWMPAAGNHENELGNGPIGFAAYQAYFAVPDNGADDELRGMWYSFTAGSVRVISLNNDDVCIQDGGNFYVRGYSGGAQKKWLEAELASARNDPRIDWIVVCMHQTAVSTGRITNGADLGIRTDWLPLFDRYGVDLVVCGHEHHYERAHPIRGTLGTDTLTPAPVSTDSATPIDTSRGTVHVVIGGGGTSIPSNAYLFAQPRCRVLTAVGKFDPAIGHKVPTYVEEDAPWSAVRDPVNPYGFVVFDLDPGTPGGETSIKATYFAVRGPFGEPTAVDEFTLVRPRTDHPGQ
ncbi:MAG: fibronectin type III domain-containing protein [Mycobacterium sp.]|nr:fibronectin type III domain-containing protein [Mycobacterium sp.]